MKRINELDLLRFLAALSVVFFHYCFRGYAADEMTTMALSQFASPAKYGYLGVDLFFIISGFVILMSASSGSAKKFIISRVVRLYPAFWACCTVTFIFTLIVGGSRYGATINQYLVNMSMLSGFVGVKYIDGVYWSLLVEMKFYFLVVLLLLFRQIDKAQLFLILWLAVTIISEFFPAGKIEWFLITEYSPYFIAGSCCYLIWSKGASITRSLILLTSWILAVSKGLSRAAELEGYYNTPFNLAVIAFFISLFFLVFLLVSFKKTGWFAGRNWVLPGSLTYPLYLVHQNVGFMIFNSMHPYVNSTFVFIFTVLFVMLISYFVHKYIELKVSPPLRVAVTKILNVIMSIKSIIPGSRNLADKLP